MTKALTKLATALVIAVISSSTLSAAAFADGTQDIITAVKQNNKNEVSKLIVLNPQLRLAAQEDGTTLVHMAVNNGNNEILKILLSAHAPNDNSDFKGTTALHIAAFAENADAVAMLLDSGADIHKKDKAGWNALYIAQAMGYKKLVLLLLKRGAKDDVFAAAAAGDTRWVKTSIKKDPALIKPLYGSNFSLLHIAATAGQDEVVKLLIENGAQLNAATSEGSPLVLAALMDKKDTVITLINAGADTNVTDANGLTALHWSAASGYTEIASILLKANANTKLLTNDGKSARDMAQEAGHTEIVSIIDKHK